MIEQAIFQLLTGDAAVASIAGTRVYPMERRQGGDLPAVVYRRISNEPIYAMNGPAGFEESRFQFDCWAEPIAGAGAFLTARNLGNAVAAVISGYRGTVAGVRIGGIFINSRTDFRGDAPGNAPRLMREMIDATLWHDA